ncbi:hypothetical protein NGM10_14015 [Halorussus salilacus]|uniref:hypothetical protein n=1 Tax=Halorussus salilacus TaxID=2953750 RepID=UPI0020A0F6A0|nr:hypothetical protein [Halorussus salilacus]USZ67836.1 hypothetical protein NGM10_14015 [Halorussus salilacus]
MGVSQEQRYANFNLYDIFANFLPGAVLVIGLLFPYVGIDGLFVEVEVGSLLVLLVSSFAVGLFVQALGGIVQSSGQDFANHIKKVDERADSSGKTGTPEPKSEINISTLDAYFIETFRAEFGLESDFTDWNRLHKLILAKLEATSRTRALRLQALYLSMRGMAATMVLLASWFGIYAILTAVDVFPTAIPFWTFPYLVAVSLVTAGIFSNRGSEFSRDVAKYMVIEYYLEVISQQDREVELDFLDETTQGATDSESDGPAGADANDNVDDQFTAAEKELLDSTMAPSTGDGE